MKEGMVPSGSISTADVPVSDNTPPVETPPAEEKIYAGKFKSDADLEKGYLELVGKLTAQGSELGAARKQAQELTQAIQAMQRPPAEQPAQIANDAMMQALNELKGVDLVEDPNASDKIVSAMSKALQVATQMTKAEAMKEATAQFNQILQQRDSNALTQDFLSKHPDFQEMQNQGVFQAFRAKNPMHDDFSAYHAAKAEQAAQAVAQLQAQLDEAKKIANLAGGDQAASKVFTKPGGVPNNGVPPKPKTLSELKAGALAAVQASMGR